eukprot:940801_1
MTSILNLICYWIVSCTSSSVSSPWITNSSPWITKSSSPMVSSQYKSGLPFVVPPVTRTENEPSLLLFPTVIFCPASYITPSPAKPSSVALPPSVSTVSLSSSLSLL